MKGPGSGGAAGQGHVRYRAFAQVATGCVTPKKTPQASETRDVRTTAELNLPFNSPEASPHTLRTNPTRENRRLQEGRRDGLVSAVRGNGVCLLAVRENCLDVFQ